MFLNSSGDFGGNTFGTGVTLSHFHSLLQAPSLIEEFIMWHKGKDICLANCFISLGSMSPGGTDLLVFILWRCFWTCLGTKKGMSEASNSGTWISESFKGSYSWLTLENLSAICSACSSLVRSSISSQTIESCFYWSYEQSLFSLEYHCEGLELFKSLTIVL